MYLKLTTRDVKGLRYTMYLKLTTRSVYSIDDHRNVRRIAFLCIFEIMGSGTIGFVLGKIGILPR